MASTEDTVQREYPMAPLVGVGAVVTDDAGDRVLLVLRGHEPSKGLWSVPGGLVHVGETLREAAAREVREECGVDVAVGDVLTVVELIQRDDDARVRYHYVLVDLAARYLGGEPAAADDASAVRWVTRPELDQLPVTKSALGVIRKAMGW